jgi:Flp pilus assembly protein TadB
MSIVWYVLIVLALVAIGGAVLRWRRTRTADRIRARDAAAPLSRNYTDERETTRTSGLSAEDQAWEADRRQRDQTAHGSDQPPPGHG